MASFQTERSSGKMGVEGGDGFARMILDVEEMLLHEKQVQCSATASLKYWRSLCDLEWFLNLFLESKIPD